MQHNIPPHFARRRSALGMLLGLLATGAAGARPITEAAAPATAKAPLIAVPLGDLSHQLERLAANRQAVPKDVMLLGGMSWPEAVVFESGDLVLIGRRDDTRPALHLDDLTVLWHNVLARGRWPYCSLDPTPDSILAVRSLDSEYAQIRSVADFQRYGQRLTEAWNVKGQTVVVGGNAVRPESRVSHAMIFPDHLMKAVAQGRVSMPGVPSLIDRSLARAREGAAKGNGGGAARFWFHAAAGQPRYRVQGNVIAIDAMDMAVFTERQISTRDGHLLDANDGQQDPLMAGFAADLSKALAVRPGRPPLPELFALLENNYRLLALLAAIEKRGLVQQSGADLSYLTQRQAEIEQKPMPQSLPGLVSFKAYESVEKTAQGELRRLQFPLAYGGVDMRLDITERSFTADRGNTLAQLAQLVAKRRPSQRVPYFLLEGY